MPQAVVVQVDCGDAALYGARCAISHQGELLGRATTSSNGYASVPLPVVEDTWTLTLTVTGQDIYPYEAPIHTTAGCAAPLVMYDYNRVDDFNGRLDPGEETDVYFVVRNLGNAAATFTLMVSSPPSNWAYDLRPSVPISDLAPDDSAVVTLTVEALGGATGQAVAVITATWQGAPEVFATAEDTTAIGYAYIYLPLALRNYR